VHIYVLGPKVLWWNFIKTFLLSITKWAHKFLADFGVFTLFDCYLVKTVAPPGDENGQSLSEWVSEKNGENIKIYP